MHGTVVSVRFGHGRQHAAVRVARPPGAVLLYRVSAPLGSRVRASVELPRVSVRLFAGTVRPADAESCSTLRRRTVCTVSIEWCPLPAGAWDVRVAKLGGPAGVVDVVLHVAVPPSARRA